MTSRKKAAKKARRAAKAANEARAKAIEDWRQENLDYTDEELEQLVALDQCHWEAELEQQLNDAKVKIREAHRLEVVADHMEAQLVQSLTKKEKKHVSTVTKTTCLHGLSECRDKDLCWKFFTAFGHAVVSEAWNNKESSLPSRINAGFEATREKYAAVWNDVAKMEEIISFCVFLGTYQILAGHDYSVESATFAFYFYEHAAVYLKKTRPEIRWHRIRDLSCDPHTLVSFYRKRIPCSCLDEIYEGVKSIPKTGVCDYPNCCLLDTKVERKKLKACTGCRKMTWYCSSECQKADWKRHKKECNTVVEEN